MNDKGARSVRLLLGYGLAACCIIALVMFAGCSSGGTDDTAQSEGPWPAEVEDVTTVLGGVGVAVSDDAPLVFSASSIWTHDGEGFEQTTTFSDDYRIAQDRAPDWDVPYLGGSQSVGSKALFIREGHDVVSDGDGVEQSERYNELLLIDPANPEERDTVIRVPGAIDAVETYVSSGESALVAIDWGADGGRVLTLVVRSVHGAWDPVWSTGSDDATQAWTPMAYGFASDTSSGEVSLVVAGDADDRPAIDEPLAVVVDSLGKERPLAAEFPGGLEDLHTLDGFETDDGAGVAFTYKTDEESGVLIASPGAMSLESFPVEGVPLGIFEDGGLSVLFRDDADTGPLATVSLETGSAVRILEDSDVKWAARAEPAHDEAARFVLVGAHVESGEQRGWSASELRISVGDGGATTRSLLSGWMTPLKSWGIVSLDEMPDDDGAAGEYVIGLRAVDEGAIATLSSAD